MDDTEKSQLIFPDEVPAAGGGSEQSQLIFPDEVKPEETSGLNPLAAAFGAVKGLAKGAFYGLPEIAAKATRFGAAELGLGPDVGKGVEEWAKEKGAPAPGAEPSAWETGGRMAAEMGLPGIATRALGLGLQRVPGVVPKAIGAALEKWGPHLVTGAFVGSQAQSTRELAQEKGVDEGWAPYLTGAAMGAAITVGNKMFGKFLQPLGKVGQDLMQNTSAQGALAGSIARMAHEMVFKTIPTVVPTMMGMTAAVAEIERSAGIRPEADPWREAVGVIGPTAIMSLITGGVGQATRSWMAAKNAEILHETIPNLDTENLGNLPPDQKALYDRRNAVAEGILNEIPAENKDLRRTWWEYARERIDNNDEIDVTTPMSKLSLEIDSAIKSMPESKAVSETAAKQDAAQETKVVREKAAAEEVVPPEAELNKEYPGGRVGYGMGGHELGGVLHTERRPVEPTLEGIKEEARGEVKKPAEAEQPKLATWTSPSGDKWTAEERPIERVPLSQVRVMNPDVENFKRGANEKGVVEGQELQGEWKGMPTSPIVLWERDLTEPGTYDVVTGRHRTEFRQRLGLPDVNAHIFKESEGFTARDAVMIDAEQNILDGKGTDYDYSLYFRQSGISETDAKSRNLLREDKAVTAFALGKNATPATWEAYRAGDVEFKRAAAIAKAGPDDPGLQNAGLKMVHDNPRVTPLELQLQLQSLATMERRPPAPSQGTLEGLEWDDSVIEQGRLEGKQAAKIVNQLSRDARNINAAIRNQEVLQLTPEAMTKYGITNPKDKNQLTKARMRILDEMDQWSKFATNPALTKIIRDSLAQQHADFDTPILDRQDIEAGADLAPLKARFLKDMVGRSPERTVISELLQNSLDATRDNKGTISVEVSPDTMRVVDTGAGMTPDVMSEDFVKLAKQGTKGELDMGGFGLAKLPIMGWPDSFEVISVAEIRTGFDAKDPLAFLGIQKIRSTISGTRDDYMLRNKVRFHKEPVDDDTPTGTVVNLRKEGLDLSRISATVNDFISQLRTGQEVKLTSPDHDGITIKSERLEDAPTAYKVSTLTFPELDTDVYIKFTKKRAANWSNQIPTKVYNKGLLLPDIPSYSSLGNFKLSRKPRFNIEINFTRTPPASDTDRYPFLVNRTRLRNDVEQGIHKAVNDKLLNLELEMAEAAQKSLKKLFSQAPTIGGTKIIIPMNEPSIVSGVRDVIQANEPVFTALGKVFQSFGETLAKYTDIPEHAFAITTHQEVHGFRPRTGLLDKNYIAINPFSFIGAIHEALGPEAIRAEQEKAATGIVDTMLHEAAHYNRSGHYEEFVEEFHRLIKDIRHRELAALEEEADEFFAIHGQDIATITGTINRIQRTGTVAEIFSEYTPEHRVTDRQEKGPGVYAAGVEPAPRGEPVTLTLYRGLGRKPADAGDFGQGAYHSSLKVLADQYDEKGDAKQVSVTLNNPLRLTTEEAYRLADDQYGTIRGKNPVGSGIGSVEDRQAASEQMTSDLKSQGYDGIIVTDKEGTQEVVVFPKPSPKGEFPQTEIPGTEKQFGLEPKGEIGTAPEEKAAAPAQGKLFAREEEPFMLKPQAGGKPTSETAVAGEPKLNRLYMLKRQAGGPITEHEKLLDRINSLKVAEPPAGYLADDIVKSYEDAIGQTFPYRELLPVLKKLGTTFSFKTEKLNHPESAAAAYDIGTNQVIFNELSWDIYPNTVSKFNELFTHEAIHAIVINLRKTNPTAYNMFQLRLEMFYKDLGPHLGEADPFIQRTIANVGLHNEVDELVNLAFTNPVFAKWLDSIQAKEGAVKSVTFWGRLKEIILNALQKATGISPTKLDELNGIMDEFVRNVPGAEGRVYEEAKAKTVLGAEDYKAQADKLGIGFKGMMEGVTQSRPLFHDPVTQDTFGINKGETLKDSLARVRAKFNITDKQLPAALDSTIAAVDRFKEKADKATDNVEVIRNAKEGLALGYEGAKRAFYPAGLSPEAGKAAELFIELMGKKFSQDAVFKGKLNNAVTSYGKSTTLAGKALDSMQTSMGNYADLVFNKMPKNDQYDFIYRIQSGQRQKTPELQSIADVLSRMFDDLYRDLERVTPGATKYRQGYFPGMWEQEAEAKKFFEQRSLEGSKAHLEPKVFDDIWEGIHAGFTPRGNPIDMAFAKLHDVQKYVISHSLLQQMEQSGAAILVRSGDKTPGDYKLVPEPYGLVVRKEAGSPTEQIFPGENIPEKTIAYRYAVKDDIGQLFTNYLSASLYENKYVGPYYTGYMTAANHLNQFQLGVGSAFHAGFTTLEAVVSKFALGIKALARGDTTGAAKHMIEAPLQVYKNPMMGGEILKAYRGEAVTGKEIPQMVAWLEMAGARDRMESRFRTNSTDKMIADWTAGRKVAATLRSPFAIVEQLARPILEWLVPRQKFGVFSEMATEWNRVHPEATHEETRTAMQYIWNRVDSRLGQVVYERMLTHNVAKNAVQALMRAPGWTGGTILEVGGGTMEMIKGLKDIMAGKKPVMTDKMAYTMSLIMVTGLINGVMTALLTGEMPKDEKDLLSFRTGRIDEAGNPERFLLPTYAKDIYAYMNKPGTTLLNKAHPMLSLMIDIAKNKDYYGVQIREPDDPAIKKAIDMGAYATKAFTPFWIRGAQKAEQRGTTLAGFISPLVGVMPATAEFTKTESQKVMLDILRNREKGSMTKEAFARQRLMSQLEQKLRNQDETVPGEIENHIREGDLTPRDKFTIYKAARTPFAVRVFKMLSMDEALRVYSAATPQEKVLYQPMIRRKMSSMQNMLPDKKKDIMEKLREQGLV